MVSVARRGTPTERGRTRGPVVPAGRREQRKHSTRLELLEAGRRLFGERGLYESRIEDLTRRAGIAKGTLYGYFPHKEALIEAVVRAGLADLLSEVHREVRGTRSRAAALSRVSAVHLRFFEAHPDLMRVLHQVRGLLKFRRPGSRRLRRVIDEYLAALAQVLALHGAPRREGEGTLALATVLFGAISGIVSVHASLGRPLPAAARRGAMLRGLVALGRSFDAAAPTPAPRRHRRRVRRIHGS